MRTYVAPDLTGHGRHARVDVTDADIAEFGDMLARLVDDGVARFGSLDGFLLALQRHNAERVASH